MGEYLLIGEGTDIFKSKDFLPLYVTDITQNSTFYVGNSSAYIVFVSESVHKIDNKIEISWSRKEVKPLPKPKEDPFGVLNSSLICFYNYTAAIQEFDKAEEEQFKLFRQSFASIAKSHGKDKNIDSLDQTAIKLFGHPTEVHIDTIDSSALSILLKVMYEGKSIFTWNELQKIIEKFEQSDTDLLMGYKVGKCPQENKELPYKDKWSFLIYAMVPLIGFLALMTWAWRQNIFSQKCKPEKEEKLCPAPPIVAEPNPYEMTAPKVCLYDGDCRRGTLIQGSMLPETEERDEEIVVEMNLIPSISRESDTLNRYLSSRRSKKRSSIQSLIDQNEETRKPVPRDRTMQMRTESEHLYDSVSNREMNETKL